MTKTIIPIKYKYNDPATHFEEMIEQDDVKNTIFIYNENIKQWQDKMDYRCGGGNAVMRPYRLDGITGVLLNETLGSWGIPTGCRHRNAEYHAQTRVIEKLEKDIDTAFDELIEYLKKYPSIDTIYYSADKKSNDIGIEIFAGTLGSTKQNVINKFNEGFEKLEKELGFTRLLHNSHPDLDQ